MLRLKPIGCAVLCLLALSGCASLQPAPTQVVEVKPAQLPPPPADVMVPREANFRQELLRIFGASQPEQTK